MVSYDDVQMSALLSIPRRNASDASDGNDVMDGEDNMVRDEMSTGTST